MKVDQAAAPKMRDFADRHKDTGMDGVKLPATSIPIKAAREQHTPLWRRVKVTAFSVMAGKH